MINKKQMKPALNEIPSKHKNANIIMMILFMYGALLFQVILFFYFAQRLDILVAWIFFSI